MWSDHIVLLMIIGAIAIPFIYLWVRFGTSAYYRSRAEYKKQFKQEETKNASTNN